MCAVLPGAAGPPVANSRAGQLERDLRWRRAIHAARLYRAGVDSRGSAEGVAGLQPAPRSGRGVALIWRCCGGPRTELRPLRHCCSHLPRTIDITANEARDDPSEAFSGLLVPPKGLALTARQSLDWHPRVGLARCARVCGSKT